MPSNQPRGQDPQQPRPITWLRGTAWAHDTDAPGEKTAEYSVWAIPGFGFAQPPNGSAIAVGGDWIPVATSLGAPLSGSYTLLLQLTDSSGNTCYDIQRVWLDNQDLQGLSMALGSGRYQRSPAA